MDLEHTNLGKHCDVSDCNQRDFLPFTCDVCSKCFCLSHRNYAAHDCIGQHSKDVTSLDCPLCGKAVKFVKSKIPDEVWNDHYLTSCTQQHAEKITAQCFELTCQRALGPSNRFTCSKCNQTVCLSHRVPEDHHCQGMRGMILSKLPTTSKPTTSSSSTTRPNNITKSTTLVPAKSKTTTPKYDIFSCPMCSMEFRNTHSLQGHINNDHPENNSNRRIPIQNKPIIPTTFIPVTNSVSSGNSSNTAVTNSTDLGRAREVCPICQARFVDPVDLVTHFETTHNDTSGSNNSNNNGTRNKAECVLG